PGPERPATSATSASSSMTPAPRATRSSRGPSSPPRRSTPPSWPPCVSATRSCSPRKSTSGEHAPRMTRCRHEWGSEMIHRELGRSGVKGSAIGLGCMGMSEFYDPGQMNEDESIRVIHRYLDAGGNFLDTADVYGVGRNEILVGKAIRDRRDRVILATK